MCLKKMDIKYLLFKNIKGNTILFGKIFNNLNKIFEFSNKKMLKKIIRCQIAK